MKKIFLILLIIISSFRLVYLSIIPFGALPDEKFHFQRIQNIADSKSISPEFPNNEYYQPPLYYVLGSLIYRFFGRSYLTLRVFSFLMSFLYLILLQKVISNLSLSKSVSIALFISIALIPTFNIESIAINNDILLYLLLMSFYFVFLRVYRKLHNFRYILLISIISGGAILTKQVGVIVIPSFIIFALKNKIPLKIVVLNTCLSLLVGLLWFYYDWKLYGNPVITYSLFRYSIIGSMDPFSFPLYIKSIIVESAETYISAVGEFNNIRIGALFYLSIYLLIFIALLGLIRGKVKNFLNVKNIVFFHLVFIFNLIIFIFLNFHYAFQPQGRYLYPSQIYISLLLVIGFTNLFSGKKSILLPFFIFLILVFGNFWSLNCITSVYYKISYLPSIFACKIIQ